MTERQWIDDAMSDDSLVVEMLLRLSQAEPSPLPPLGKTAPALNLEWSVRQRRSKHVPRKKGEMTRASPTTPLSWSGATSGSGGGGATADGIEESSQPSKPIENTRSKVAGTGETTTTHKRSRRKKTLAELKEEENLLLNERRDLKDQLATLRVAVEQERTTNERLKRRKLDILSHQASETVEAIANQPVEIACEPSSSVLPSNEHKPFALNGSSSKVHGNENLSSSFVLPDLNLPVEDNSGCRESI